MERTTKPKKFDRWTFKSDNEYHEVRDTMFELIGKFHQLQQDLTELEENGHPFFRSVIDIDTLWKGLELLCDGLNREFITHFERDIRR